jgi:hypothetical protein
MSRNYYIYYRVSTGSEHVRAAVGAMQVSLARESHVQGRLLQSCNDPSTWMEVYEGIEDGERFERQLTAAIDRFGLRALLATATDRHVEIFVEA